MFVSRNIYKIRYIYMHNSDDDMNEHTNTSYIIMCKSVFSVFVIVVVIVVPVSEIHADRCGVAVEVVDC